MSHDVFISYARSESAVAAIKIRKALEEKNITVFLDEQDIAPGARFPGRLADALLSSRIVLILADVIYFNRPWCVYEFQAAITPYRHAVTHGTETEDTLDHIVVALGHGIENTIGHLPPPLADLNWPEQNDTDTIIALLLQRLETVTGPLNDRLIGCREDPATHQLSSGGDVPPPGNIIGRPLADSSLPQSLKNSFLGRTEELWHLFHILETSRVRNSVAACAVLGMAGVGKTQLAAEYVWRYAPQTYPGGLIWIDADVDDRALEEQFRAVIRTFAPNEPIPPQGNMFELQETIRVLMAKAASKGRILWVVDNLPTPSSDKPLKPMKHWCPARNVVDLLCTSRRALLPDVDMVLELRELTPKAAIELLAAPPLTREQMSEDDWLSLALWVGCLPLALRILHTTLWGFADVSGILARARGEEPAAALDDEVEALKGEISPDYVRGVAEALHEAYVDLSAQPSLLEATHLLSWLAPKPTTDQEVSSFITRRQLGQLSNRGWIEAIPVTAGQSLDWRMHRVISSYLRTRCKSPEKELTFLVETLLDSLEEKQDWGLIEDLIPHTDYVLSGLRQCDWEKKQIPEELVQAILGLAIYRLSEPRAEFLRYQSALLLKYWGKEEELIRQLQKRLGQGDTDTDCGIAGLLPAIGTAAAAEICTQLLKSQNRKIKEHTLEVADRLASYEAVPPALLNAILAETNLRLAFSELPDKPKRYYYQQPGYRIESTGPDGKPQSVHWDHSFWKMIKSAEARDCLIRLANGPDADKTVEHLVTHLGSAKTSKERLAAIDRLGLLLKAMYTPSPIRIETVHTIDRATGQVLKSKPRISTPKMQESDPQIYAPLIEIILNGENDELRNRAALVSLYSESGSKALSEKAHSLLDDGQTEQALQFSEHIVKADRRYINGYWWRGLAKIDLKRFPDALKDIEVVLKQKPKFTDALDAKAEILMELGDYEKMTGIADLLVKLEPKAVRGYYWRGIAKVNQKRFPDALKDIEVVLKQKPKFTQALDIKAEILMELGDYEKVTEIGDLLVKLEAEVARGYYWRGLALKILERYEDALNDFEKVLNLEPDNVDVIGHYAELLHRLGYHDECVEQADRLLTFYPDSSWAHFHKAASFFELEKNDAVVDATTKAIAHKPDFAEAFFLRAYAFLHLDNQQAAYNDAKKACELDPGNKRYQELMDYFSQDGEVD